MGSANLKEKVEMFFTSPAYGVVGASNNRNKYGNKVLRVYLQHKKTAYPVNPKETIVEGLNCVPDVIALPKDVQSISIITPPKVTEAVVATAIQKGIRHIWMQPGAESDAAIKACEENGINVIAGGPCIIAMLGLNE